MILKYFLRQSLRTSNQNQIVEVNVGTEDRSGPTLMEIFSQTMPIVLTKQEALLLASQIQAAANLL